MLLSTKEYIERLENEDLQDENFVDYLARDASWLRKDPVFVEWARKRADEPYELE